MKNSSKRCLMCCDAEVVQRFRKLPTRDTYPSGLNSRTSCRFSAYKRMCVPYRPSKHRRYTIFHRYRLCSTSGRSVHRERLLPISSTLGLRRMGCRRGACNTGIRWSIRHKRYAVLEEPFRRVGVAAKRLSIAVSRDRGVVFRVFAYCLLGGGAIV